MELFLQSVFQNRVEFNYISYKTHRLLLKSSCGFQLLQRIFLEPDCNFDPLGHSYESESIMSVQALETPVSTGM